VSERRACVVIGQSRSTQRPREECLNTQRFETLFMVKVLLGDWRREHNHDRTHSDLRRLTPANFAKSWKVQHQKRLATLVAEVLVSFHSLLPCRWFFPEGTNLSVGTVGCGSFRPAISRRRMVVFDQRFHRTSGMRNVHRRKLIPPNNPSTPGMLHADDGCVGRSLNV